MSKVSQKSPHWRGDLALPGSPHFTRESPPQVVIDIHAAIELGLGEPAAPSPKPRCEHCRAILRKGNDSTACDPCKLRHPEAQEPPAPSPLARCGPHITPCARDGCNAPVNGPASKRYCSPNCKRIVENRRKR